jgi:hypothetical protein
MKTPGVRLAAAVLYAAAIGARPQMKGQGGEHAAPGLQENCHESESD